jgi:hypothetical protein
MPASSSIFFSIEHVPLGRFQDSTHAPDHAHQKNHIRILKFPFEEVAEDIVGDAPDEGDYFA